MQKLVEQDFCPGEFVDHFPQASCDIPEQFPGLLLELLPAGKFLLDHGAGQGGKGNLFDGSFLSPFG